MFILEKLEKVLLESAPISAPFHRIFLPLTIVDKYCLLFRIAF